MGVRPDPAAKPRLQRPAGTGAGPELARRAAELAREKKAEDVVLLDLRSLDAVSDFFLLVSGTSEVQVRTIAEHIRERLGEQGFVPWHVEGMENRRWVLLDYVDLVVHVFHVETRSYYLLERLWGDARRVPLPED